MALVQPGRRVRTGTVLRFGGAELALHAEVLGRHDNGQRTVRLSSADRTPVREAIRRLGRVPLPPYITREDHAGDRDSYQTVFARQEGSIAAPTAGLHFTRELLEELNHAGVERTTITLHVGFGTFQPVRAELVADHRMEHEHYEVSAEAASALTRAKRHGRRIIAVGTTTTRTLESLTCDDEGTFSASCGSTDLFIAPGFRFRVVEGLVTNFHVPRSSLLMLVSAFAGVEAVRHAYEAAVAERYRFYSYGDAMGIF